MKTIDIKTLAIWLLSTILLMTIGFVIDRQFQLQYFKDISKDAIIEKYIYMNKIEILDELIKEAKFQKDHFFDPLLEYNQERQHELDSLTFVYKWDKLDESLGGGK